MYYQKDYFFIKKIIKKVIKNFNLITLNEYIIPYIITNFSYVFYFNYNSQKVTQKQLITIQHRQKLCS